MALSQAQFEALKEKLAERKAASVAAAEEENKKAIDFVNKPIANQIASVEFLKALPRGLTDTFIKAPAKLAVSAMETGDILKTGKIDTSKEYDIPLVGKIKSFQSDYQNAADKVISGERSLKSMVNPFSEGSITAPVMAGLDVLGTEGMARGGVRALQGATKASGEFLSGLVNKVKGIVPAEEGGGVITPVLKGIGEKSGLTRYLSEKNVGEQAKTAFKNSAEKLKKDYEEFYDMTVKQIKDAKADTALNKVGNETGKAFDKVIAMRKAAGAKMSSSLEKIGKVKTDVGEAVTNLTNRLKNEAGLVYDEAKQGFVSLGKQTKMTSAEQGFLQNFLDELKNLGTKPTVQELDAFLSRIPKEMDIYKNKNAITGTTHAESLVKNTLSNLRGAFDPKKNPAFKSYSAARDAYAKLSTFLDEGVGFLGKKTLSGDYAKDASLLKSSIQSLLNNGKKDFLINLEKLTGYPAIDKAVVALQAMKDAGDFKGLSLLETLSGQGSKAGTFADIPTSKSGLVDRALKYGMEKVGQIVGGTPKERTLHYIKDIKK